MECGVGVRLAQKGGIWPESVGRDCRKDRVWAGCGRAGFGKWALKSCHPSQDCQDFRVRCECNCVSASAGRLTIFAASATFSTSDVRIGGIVARRLSELLPNLRAMLRKMNDELVEQWPVLGRGRLAIATALIAGVVFVVAIQVINGTVEDLRTGDDKPTKKDTPSASISSPSPAPTEATTPVPLRIVDVNLVPERDFALGPTYAALEPTEGEPHYLDEKISASIAQVKCATPSVNLLADALLAKQADDEAFERRFNDPTFSRSEIIAHLKLADAGQGGRPEDVPAVKGRILFERIEQFGRLYGNRQQLFSAIVTRLSKSAARRDLGPRIMPVYEIIVQNPADVPQLLLGLRPKTLAWSGEAQCGGGDGSTMAYTLPLIAETRITFEVFGDEEPSRFPEPILIPAHGYGRLRVRIEMPQKAECYAPTMAVGKIVLIADNGASVASPAICARGVSDAE